MSWHQHNLLQSLDPRVLLLLPRYDERGNLQDIVLEFASDEALEWLGLQDVQGKSLVREAAHVFTKQVLAQWTGLLREKERAHASRLMWRRAGTMHTVEVELSQREGRVLVRVLSRSNSDISSETEGSLLDTFTQSLAANVIDLLPTPVFLKDDQHRWIAGNKAFCEIIGLSIEELLGKSDFDFFPEEEAQVFWDMDDVVMTQKRASINEESLTDAQGVKRWILTHKIPIELENGRSGLLGYFTDITQRKLAERQLIHSMEVRDKLTELSETKSLFLARMSHELRTPLNAIMGYSELAEEEAEDTGCDALIPDLHNIQKASHHLLNLINDVLDLAKIEQGKLVPVAQTFDVQELIQECGAMLGTSLSEAVTLRTVVDPKMPQAHTDKRRLKQAVLNLLSNAAKFTLAGEIVLEAQALGQDLSIRVSDSGPGIEESMRSRLFLPFESISRDGKNLREGTGIGLSLTRHLCNLLGGDVDLQSTQEQGSTFVIRVPLRLQEHMDTQPPQVLRVKSHDELVKQFDHAGAVSKTTILLIDDDPTMYDLARRFRPNDNVQILWASSPKEGLELAQSAKPSLILLDIFMPTPVGWEVLKQLKADERTRAIPVVVLSFAEDPSRAQRSGAHATVAKPLSSTQWRELLDV